MPPSYAFATQEERNALAQSIPGNASPSVKAHLVNMMAKHYGHETRYRRGFAMDIARRLVLAEVSERPKLDEPTRQEVQTILELPVEEDMLNAGGSMHGGCTAFLIDICSSLGLAAAGRSGTVSQALNVTYHAPAVLGCHLRIVNTTMAVGSRVSSIRCEIWDSTNKRLVATGIHMKMLPSPPAKL